MYSEARQDEFVLHMVEGKVGTYLEIGAWRPTVSNNTYLLEQKGWTGLSIDISNVHEKEWLTQRKNPLVIADATTYNYQLADHIDYLQLDVEPPEQTFKVLQELMKLPTVYSVITYETDAYGDPRFVEPSRELLASRGYVLAVADVLCKGGPFEDWYINPNYINVDLIKTWK